MVFILKRSDFEALSSWRNQAGLCRIQQVHYRKKVDALVQLENDVEGAKLRKIDFLPYWMIIDLQRFGCLNFHAVRKGKLHPWDGFGVLEVVLDGEGVIGWSVSLGLRLNHSHGVRIRRLVGLNIQAVSAL
jgi:hypothetical protein